MSSTAIMPGGDNDEIDRLLIIIERLKDCLKSAGVSDALVEGIAADPPSAAEAIRHEYSKQLTIVHSIECRGCDRVARALDEGDHLNIDEIEGWYFDSDRSWRCPSCAPDSSPKDADHG